MDTLKNLAVQSSKNVKHCCTSWKHSDEINDKKVTKNIKL